MVTGQGTVVWGSCRRAKGNIGAMNRPSLSRPQMLAHTVKLDTNSEDRWKDIGSRQYVASSIHFWDAPRT